MYSDTIKLNSKISIYTILYIYFFSVTDENMLFVIIHPLVQAATSQLFIQEGRRLPLSSSKHAVPSENPQLGQEGKIDESQAHQQIFQWVQ